MLKSQYKKIIENDRKIMAEQRERIEALKNENANLLYRLQELELKQISDDTIARPIEAYMGEVERLVEQRKEKKELQTKVKYIEDNELEKLIVSVGGID